MFKPGRLYITPALAGNVLIVTLCVPLHSRRQSFSLLKSNTFSLPIHGHLSQIVHISTYLIVSSSQIGLPNADAARRCQYMSNEDTCHIEVATQTLASSYCAKPVCQCNTSSNVKVIKGCSSCLYNVEFTTHSAHFPLVFIPVQIHIVLNLNF